MTPSWYDVLGVEASATTDEIRAAWKDSIDGLDPSDRRFRQRSRAAEVLLDATRRAAHDAELALSDDELGTDDETADPTPVPTLAKPAKPAKQDGATSDVVDHATGSTRRDQAPVPADDTDARSGGSWVTSVLVVGALGLLALVLVVATVVSLVRGGDDASPQQAASSDSSLPDARAIAAARAAAESAIGPVVSYDYRTLEKSKQDALAYLTPGYAEEYLATFETIEANAPASKTIVTAEVLASGIVRTGVGRVDVLLYVNRPTRNISSDRTSRDQVTARMVDVEGQWLIGCLIAMPGGLCDA